jgi:hypothetical protein
VCVRSANDARQAAAMLMSVFRYCDMPLDLHVVAGSELVMQAIGTVLYTSELNRGRPIFYVLFYNFTRQIYCQALMLDFLPVTYLISVIPKRTSAA